MKAISKTYDTRRKRRAAESAVNSRVDWKRTKRDSISRVLDSDESYTSEEEETGEESDDGSSTHESEDQPEEASRGDEEDGDEGRIRKSRLKSRSAAIDSESSSDSDGPGERVNAKRTCVIKEDDSDGAEDEEAKAHNKKQKRMEKLKALAEKQKSRSRTTRHKETEECSQDAHSPSPPETPCESEDSGDLSDFIVQDEEVNNNGDAENPTPSYKDLLRKHHISLSDSHDLSSHLQKVIKAFLINIVDEEFLISLYEGARKKRYAKDMLNSLNQLDNRIIGPRLEKLTTSCRWTKKYKERLNSYPELHVKNVAAEEASCEACELYRTCSYRVTLSGQAYDYETLEDDDFLKNDKQKMAIGGVCCRRTEAYHQLRHYKYCLYQRCIPFIDKTNGDSANKIVDLALSAMDSEGFLNKEVSFLEGYLGEADYFQEERLFS